jgi:hypothetical protein
LEVASALAFQSGRAARRQPAGAANHRRADAAPLAQSFRREVIDGGRAVIPRGGVATLIPGTGFHNLYDNFNNPTGVLAAAFVNLVLQY